MVIDNSKVGHHDGDQPKLEGGCCTKERSAKELRDGGARAMPDGCGTGDANRQVEAPTQKHTV